MKAIFFILLLLYLGSMFFGYLMLSDQVTWTVGNINISNAIFTSCRRGPYHDTLKMTFQILYVILARNYGFLG